MEKYGIENVRGGIYSKVVLTAAEISHIEQVIRHNNGLCQRCGRKGHYVNKCFASTHADGSSILTTGSRSIKPYISNDMDLRSPTGGCLRCGRMGHHIKDCYAFTNVSGKYIGKP
jgi:hypothetical protein